MAIGYKNETSGSLSALSNTDSGIMSKAELINSIAGSDKANVLRPEVFYDTQLLDTIRDAAECYQ